MNYWTKELNELLSEFSNIEEIKNYTFVGGSALAYYLKHRISYDIDLFSPENFLDFKIIDKIIKKIKKHYNVVKITKTSEQVDYIINNVNVKFCASGISQLNNFRKNLKKQLYIGTPELLCAMKVYAIGRRATIKDYFDIYVILKKEIFNLNELKEITEKIFGEYFFKKLFFKQLLLVTEIKESLSEFDILIDHKEIDKDEIKNFFKQKINEAIKSQG